MTPVSTPQPWSSPGAATSCAAPGSGAATPPEGSLMSVTFTTPAQNLINSEREAT
jgi:hypothetical protein